MVGRELLSGAFVDKAFVQQPFDGPALSPYITQGIPRLGQLGVISIDLVLESPERSSSLQ